MKAVRLFALVPCVCAATVLAQEAPALPADLKQEVERTKERMIEAPVTPRTNPATRPGAWSTTTVPGGGKLAILSLTETRPSQGSGQIALMLELVDANLGPLASVRRTLITQARDDRDFNLVPVPNVSTGAAPAANAGLLAIVNASSPAPAAGAGGRGGRAGGGGGGGGAAAVPPGTLRGTTALTVGRREAVAIKTLEGELEVLAPSSANGALISFPAIAGQLGKPLAHPLLAREGMEFILVNAATVQALGERNYAPPRGGQLGPLVIEGMALWVRDPSSRLAGLFLQDASGRTLPFSATTLRTTTEGDYLFDLRPAQPLPADAQLVLHLAIPEAIRRIPFRFDNVPLP